MARQSIVDKINELSEFELSNEEIKFILENWISSHSKHRSTVNLSNTWDQKSGASLKADVEIDKMHSFKYF